MIGDGKERAVENQLEASQSDIWLVSLPALRRRWPDWESALMPDEKERARRFHRNEDAFRFGASRAALRRLLGRYLGLTPGEVQIGYNRFGKPALAAPAAPGRRLNFNLSHAGNFALIGFACARPIGVDIEGIQRQAPYASLAEAVCGEAERREIEALPETERMAEVTTFWACKEAYVKALGVGLSFPHRQVGVTRRQGAEGKQDSCYVLGARGRWSLFSLSDVPGYAGAVVVWGDGIVPRRRHWPEEEAWSLQIEG
jgi:4'-phosphopantetheinyl transferase